MQLTTLVQDYANVGFGEIVAGVCDFDLERTACLYRNGLRAQWLGKAQQRGALNMFENDHPTIDVGPACELKMGAKGLIVKSLRRINGPARNFRRRLDGMFATIPCDSHFRCPGLGLREFVQVKNWRRNEICVI